MINPEFLPAFITDTHCLYWFRQGSHRLSQAADAIFRQATAGEAHIIIPAIVIAELYYLMQKLGVSLSLPALFQDLSQSTEFIFSELGQAQLEAMERIQGITEMHDRLIAAEALVRQAPIISNDRVLRQSNMLQVIW
jgi:PIN domain nuclease of toxin-antitoxin system